MSLNEEKDYLKRVKFKKQLENLKLQLTNKKILIYGAGILFETAFKNYDFSGMNIVGISDKRFELEKSPSEFCGLKTFKPEEIKNLEIDCILVGVKEYQNLIRCFITEYSKVQILPLVKKITIQTFKRRNINHNIYVEKRGLHGKKPKNLSQSQLKILDFKQRFKTKFGLLEIPQIEFNITTKCSLRCKHCSNFIPYIKPEEHSLISIEDFKAQVDNLLKAVYKVKNLLLIGGEPLLVKNLCEYLEYAASKKKIERVWIVTNGTLLMNDNLLKIAKKYRKKLTIWVSNYSKNEELKNKLKHDELLSQIETAKIDYDYVQDLTWGYTSPLCAHKKRDNKKEYFENCGNNCIAVFDGKIYVCPRAGTFVIKGLYTPEKDEVVDLNKEKNPKILKQKLIDFYSRDYFTACNYCTVLEDRTMERILPAIQLQN